MKTLKMATILGAAVFFLFCFVGISLGFNPQPEPPGADQMTQPGQPQGGDALQTGPGILTETNPDNIKIKPLMSEPITDTKPLNLQGSPKMISPDDSPGDPKMIDPGDDGYREDDGEGPTPGMKSQKRMNRKMRRY